MSGSESPLRGSILIKVIVVDDEQPARERLLSFLAEYDEIQVLGEASNGADAVGMANELKPDVLFLDIQMPRMDGFEVVRALTHDAIVVFTTAYDEYAIEAFNVHALDYLLKPFSKDRFRQSIDQLKKVLVDPDDYKDRTRSAVDSLSSAEDYLQRVSVRDKHVYAIIPVEEILCFKIVGGLVYIQTKEREFQTDTTLNQFEKRLDPRTFMRIHRNAIVNLEKILRLMPWGQGRLAVVLENSSSLQVSRERMKDFKIRMGLRV